MDDCIENARDMMAGGTRYAGASVSLIGVGTVVDSLYAVKQLVFDEQRVTLDALGHILEADFEGHERLRQYTLRRIQKYGRDNETMGPFSAELFADLARVTSGRPNTRGGHYEASLFAYRSFVRMGTRTPATPDGRRAGEPLSPGMGPSPLALGACASIGALLSALQPLDLTAYPVVAVLDMKLPWASAGLRPEVIVPVIRRFLEVGGSVLQLNVVDPAALQEARTHPERHADLVVRVSGYSARFTTLPGEIQEEIIARAMAVD
jgi:formate C-acetyltransferase